VAVLNVLAVLLAVSVLALLPCLVVLLVYADNVIDATARAIRRFRRRRQRLHAEPEPIVPPLQQIAGDLHRLGVARLRASHGSVRHAAVTRAYDRRLVHACLALNIEEHLADLDELDLELERLRVEGALLESGFVLASVNDGLDVDGRQER
jgi:hypothetical protein